MSRRILIINADDLGLSNGVNQGIEQAHQNGLVTSATLLTNMPGFSTGVEVAYNNPDLGIGIHLNIIRGEPLSPTESVLPLLDTSGKFFSNIYQIGRLAANPEFQKAAEQEYRQQIEKVLDACLKPDHLDFEKHHGIWKPLYKIGCQLADEYGLAIRSYREPLFFITQNFPYPGLSNLWQSLHLRLYSTLFHKKISTPRPNYFFGQSHIGKIDTDYLKSLIKTLPFGVSELMTHPGKKINQEDELLKKQIGSSWITDRREAELTALTNKNILAILKDTDIQLTTFKEGLNKL